MASAGKIEVQVDADVDPAIRELRRLDRAIQRASIPAIQFRYGFFIGLISGVLASSLSRLLDGLL